MNRSRWIGTNMVLAVVLSVAAAASGQFFRGARFGGGAAGPGMVQLPYMSNDNNGNNWRIYQGGWFQQQNNMPLYSQGAMLMINGQQAMQNNNQAKVEEKTGELTLDMQANGVQITRRVHIDKAGGFIRYIDIIKNTGAQQQTFQVMLQSNSNYGIQTGQNVNDPKKKDQPIGWVGQTGAGQSIVEMYAGPNSKLAPQINWPQGNSFVQATFPLAIPAGKEVALMHLHTVNPTQDGGTKWIEAIKPSLLMKTIPPAIRRIIVNFPGGQSLIGDIELLRGDLLDAVELRGGDELKGTIKDPTYSVQTFYGNVTLPADKVISIINVGQFRPRQLLVTTDGQIFGGHLKKETLDLQLSSGQVTQIPLSQVSRAGYRKRPDEPSEWTFEKPMIVLRSGERMNVQMPAGPLDVVTRYGPLSLKPQDVAAVLLQNEENNVHEIELTDGSKFAGLLTAAMFEMKLDAGNGADQTVKFPTSVIARLQLTNKVKEPDDTTPTIRLANEDQLIGTLTGKLRLDTAFDTIDVNAAELKQFGHAGQGGADVQAVLWDGTTLGGQLEDQDVTCPLASGITVKVPVALLQEYTQPQPQPSAAMVQRIQEIVKALNDEDWHARDRARAQLMSMGPSVLSVLKQMRDSQPPEAQKTIDIILAELEKQRKAEKTPGSASTAPIPGAVDNVVFFDR